MSKLSRKARSALVRTVRDDLAAGRRIDWTLLDDGEIEAVVDAGLRHRSNVTPYDYLKHWCSIGRQFAYATMDDSWGEFEKEFAIIIKVLVRFKRDEKTRKRRTRSKFKPEKTQDIRP